MKDRIKKVRKHFNLNQAEFGEKIGAKQNTIGGYETGLRNPSGLTIRAICDKFHVNEDWLRYGEGEMFLPQNRNQEIAQFMGELLNAPDLEFQRRIVSILAKLDIEEWKLLENMALRLMEEEK